MRKILILLVFLLWGCDKENNLLIGDWELFRECDIIELNTNCFDSYGTVWTFNEKTCKIDDGFSSRDGIWIVQNDNLIIEYIDLSVSLELISITNDELVIRQGICTKYFQKVE